MQKYRYLISDHRLVGSSDVPLLWSIDCLMPFFNMMEHVKLQFRYTWSTARQIIDKLRQKSN